MSAIQKQADRATQDTTCSVRLDCQRLRRLLSKVTGLPKLRGSLPPVATGTR